MDNDARACWNPELEQLPWAEVERWQAGRIAAALPALRARSGLYRTLPDVPVEAFSDLARLPFTLKDAVRAAQDAATDDAPLGANQGVPTEALVQTICSSGTTGAPLYYGLTRHDAEVFADAIANTWFTGGLRANDVVAHLVGLPMVAGGLPYADGFRRVGATLCWLGGFPTERILREMRRLRCTAMLATTSFGLFLAGQWEQPSRLAKVLAGGEPGLNQPEIRARITAGLGLTHLRECMGLGDVISGMWCECAAQDGMHFNAQKYVAVELVDPDSGEPRPWREGETGEIVYTAFDREATPLLRYRSRDHAVVVGTACACGRTSPRIRCIGRTDDMLIYKGMNVFPTALRDIVASRFGDRAGPLVRVWKATREQVRFDEAIPLDVEALAVLAPEAADALARAIEAEVRAQMQVRVAVTVLPPGGLPRGAYKNSLIALKGS